MSKLSVGAWGLLFAVGVVMRAPAQEAVRVAQVGRLLDADGSAVADAEVTIVAADCRTGLMPFDLVRVRTDARGMWRAML